MSTRHPRTWVSAAVMLAGLMPACASVRLGDEVLRSNAFELRGR